MNCNFSMYIKVKVGMNVVLKSAVKIEICFLSADKISHAHTQKHTIITIQPSTFLPSSSSLSLPLFHPSPLTVHLTSNKGLKRLQSRWTDHPACLAFIQKHPLPPIPPLDTLPLETPPRTTTTHRINTAPSVALEDP